ncbi:MAG: ribonuclease P protein component [Bacteroidetes bacterium]|nr:MAG: ribonuclease P protein component [Bacteroidota bacterium]
MHTYTFKKSERLCSTIHINKLFQKGNRVVTQFPFRVLWLEVNEPLWVYPAQVLITVSKRNFKSGVVRNRIKRQIREFYRLNKHLLYQVLQNRNQQIILAINYIGKSKMNHEELKPAVDKLFQKCIQQLQTPDKL